MCPDLEEYKDPRSHALVPGSANYAQYAEHSRYIRNVYVDSKSCQPRFSFEESRGRSRGLARKEQRAPSLLPLRTEAIMIQQGVARLRANGLYSGSEILPPGSESATSKPCQFCRVPLSPIRQAT